MSHELVIELDSILMVGVSVRRLLSLLKVGDVFTLAGTQIHIEIPPRKFDAIFIPFIPPLFSACDSFPL